MKLLALTLILCSLLLEVLSVRTPQVRDAALKVYHARSTTPGDTDLIVWPGEAAAHRLRRESGMTNMELIKRGLPPSRPKRLYGAEKVKRILPAPVIASGSANIYRFVGCFSTASTGPGFQRESFTYADNQELANKCAERQDQVTDPNRIRGLAIAGAGSVRCLTSARGGTGQQADCTAGNFAVYSL